MRKCLNILQSVHASHGATEISAEDLYATTGSPVPSDIEHIFSWLMSLPFSECYQRITAICQEKGLALQDILSAVFSKSQVYEVPPKARIFLVDALSQIEYNLNAGATDLVQLGAMVGAFKVAVDMIEH